MRAPKSVILAILRDVAYDAGLRERLGITREEIEVADRWANEMPEWATETRVKITPYSDRERPKL
jgi:hypothetical protein